MQIFSTFLTACIQASCKIIFSKTPVGTAVAIYKAEVVEGEKIENLL